MKLAIDVALDRPGFSLRVDTVIDAAACGVFGPSGSGKSTLLHLIAGLERPARGCIVLDGEVLDDTAAGIHVPTHRRRLGVVFQHGHLLPHLTVECNLRYGEALVPTGDRRVAFREVVDLLDIARLLERRPRTLSGGERQRVALGRALLCSPRLLLMDEPLAALDRGLKDQILPYLRRAHEAFALPVLHVSHDLSELLHVCDRLLLLDQGTVVAQGSMADIAADPRRLPLLHEAGMVNILRGRLVEHHEVDGLSLVELPGGVRMWSRLRPEPPGTALELLLRPAEVALALGPVTGCSLQNQLPGSITALAAGPDRVVVTIACGGQDLLTELSPRTVASLEIAIGRSVVVLFKAVALIGRGDVASSHHPSRRHEEDQRPQRLSCFLHQNSSHIWPRNRLMN